MRFYLVSLLGLFILLGCGSGQPDTKPAASAQSRSVTMEKKQTLKVKVESLKMLPENRFSLMVRLLDDSSRVVECFPNFVRREGAGLDMEAPVNKKMLGLKEMAPGTVLEVDIYWQKFKNPARALIMDFRPVN